MPLTPEEELDKLEAEFLAAIDRARAAAAIAYEFSKGSAYAYTAVQACHTVARLAGLPPVKEN